jgi:hypothetical protein
MGFLGNYVKKFIIRSRDKILPDIITKLEKQIENHKNLVKLLELTGVEDTKIIELIQKENELIDLLNKQTEYYNQMGSMFDLLNDTMSSFEIREKLEKEIINIIKELKKEKTFTKDR